MANTLHSAGSPALLDRSSPSAFELLVACNPPIFESLLAQISTETIFNLYHTSYFLQQFLQSSPTAWRYISWRLSQPAAAAVAANNNAPGVGQRQSSYALDQLLIYVMNPWSTRLVSLELDNTAVSGGTLTQTVLVLRRETLQHVSVRGCKNVSLKYHINPWLQMNVLAKKRTNAATPLGYENLALKSLYTYRCRHHRRRPYLPSSLSRKESDSEPTHELLKTCHKLGIWTDTAWCTTPGARCYRRRGYVTMRLPQDPREVWVVYDRLWRSRNWLGPVEQRSTSRSAKDRGGSRDCRSWEYDEDGENGEAIGIRGEGKAVPMHLRTSHQKFVDNIHCSNCSAVILERCEQCSVMMHCAGCRKTLCASCAFDRPYLRNLSAPESERNKFWWAPGCAVSPCSMQDQDVGPVLGGIPHNGVLNQLPSIKFKWCCTEPLFSGGGGISLGNASNSETDKIRAVPLPTRQGWEDPDFSPYQFDTSEPCNPFRTSELSSDGAGLVNGPGGRWPSIEALLYPPGSSLGDVRPMATIPRILCDDCHHTENWKIECKACAIPLCVKHDVREREKVRICGYKELSQEKQECRSRQKALKLLGSLIQHRKDKKAVLDRHAREVEASSSSEHEIVRVYPGNIVGSPELYPTAFGLIRPLDFLRLDTPESAAVDEEVNALIQNLQNTAVVEHDLRMDRPVSRGSNSTDPPSRSSSPAHSALFHPVTPEPNSAPHLLAGNAQPPSKWRGCQSFYCPISRSPGDARRRCVAVMRQCTDCKIHVCGDCVATLEAPCPCKGCRALPVSEEEPSPQTSANDVGLFFCPNCRWDRMQTGKCRRRSAAFFDTQNARKKANSKKREKLRKPLAERHSSQPVLDGSDTPSSSLFITATQEQEGIEGLVDFFEQLNFQVNSASQSNNATFPATGTLHGSEDFENPGDIQELEDMGVLARDLISRIQRLREQFRPGSVAAMVLPDIRINDGRISILNNADVNGDGLTALPVVVADVNDMVEQVENAATGHEESGNEEHQDESILTVNI